MEQALRADVRGLLSGMSSDAKDIVAVEISHLDLPHGDAVAAFEIGVAMREGEYFVLQRGECLPLGKVAKAAVSGCLFPLPDGILAPPARQLLGRCL